MGSYSNRNPCPRNRGQLHSARNGRRKIPTSRNRCDPQPNRRRLFIALQWWSLLRTLLGLQSIPWRGRS